MERMNQAYEKVKMLVGMEVDEEEAAGPAAAAAAGDSFMDEFNRQCTLTAKQVPLLLLLPPSLSFCRACAADGGDRSPPRCRVPVDFELLRGCRR